MPFQPALDHGRNSAGIYFSFPVRAVRHPEPNDKFFSTLAGIARRATKHDVVLRDVLFVVIDVLPSRGAFPPTSSWCVFLERDATVDALMIALSDPIFERLGNVPFVRQINES